LIHEKNSRDCFGVDNVIATPATVVVLNQMVGKTAERTLPGDAEAGIKVD
jgi:hypothetical protein